MALAQKRMNRAIKAIRAAGQLDRKRGWYIAEDIGAMREKLEAEIKIACGRLALAMEGEPDFKLDAQGEE